MSFLDALLRIGPTTEALATTGAPVNVSHAAPPVAGTALVATDATSSAWQAPVDAVARAAAANAGLIVPLTDIAPLHYYRGSGTVQSGGLVDQFTDVGSSPKHFTQSGAARCPTGVDGNGKIYLAPDGAADCMQAGAQADWKFLHNGGPFTVAMVYHRTAVQSAREVVLDSCQAQSGGTGFTLELARSSATDQGPVSYFANGSVKLVAVAARGVNTSLSVLIVRYSGIHGTDDNSLGADAQIRLNGLLAATRAAVGTPSVANPTGVLTLFATTVALGTNSAVRLYELLIHNAAISDRLALGYENYARLNYGTPG